MSGGDRSGAEQGGLRMAAPAQGGGHALLGLAGPVSSRGGAAAARVVRSFSATPPRRSPGGHIPAAVSVVGRQQELLSRERTLHTALSTAASAPAESIADDATDR
jgi:hypothetical protein